MQNDKKTCGPMYLEACQKYGGEDRWTHRAFVAGFVSGQAEKVYLGACRGAMFRPSSEHAELVNAVVDDVCRRYELKWTSQFPEFWICRDDSAIEDVLAMFECVPNSAAWHFLRASLCGIPSGEIDYQFHHRKGYGERCDPSLG